MVCKLEIAGQEGNFSLKLAKVDCKISRVVEHGS